uniref:Beta-fructofuranosidase, insoluble isoenzyme 4 n=1 Tax=Aegilops tauschii subsp. strangulata TaxID=200361 RepID=A0A453N0X0_AEGTS
MYAFGLITSIKSTITRVVDKCNGWLQSSGPLYYKGLYHLFYQYNPGSVVPGNKTWAHSVSADLVNWLRLESALDRTEPYDAKGCWSGSVTVLADGRPAILYTGADDVKNQAQCIAFPSNSSDPYLREWTKPSSNPVIRPDGPGLTPNQFRDPTTGWTGPDGQWRIAVGAELDGYSAALLYKSEDFVSWSRVDHPLYSSNSSTMWECPDFFAALPGNTSGLDLSAAIPNRAKHVLKMSLDSCDKYMVGVYDLEADKFVPDNVVDDRRLWLRIDYGNYYASKSFFDAKKGRRIIWGWANESDSSSDDAAKGWAGIQALPRTIWLDSDGSQLLQWPVEEVESLRRNETNHQGIELKKGDMFEIKGTDTLQADVEIEFEPGTMDEADAFDPSWLLNTEKHCREADASAPGGLGPFGLVVLASDDMEEHTAVHFRVYKSKHKHMILMCSDLRRSSLRSGLYTPAYGGFFEFDLEKEKKISLRTLVRPWVFFLLTHSYHSCVIIRQRCSNSHGSPVQIDRSAVESFGGGGRVCIMARVYPVALVDDRGAHMYAFNNGTTAVMVSQLKAWSMKRAQVNVKKG